MGNWQLEVFKMAIYMAFPVTSFYIFHRIDWFEDVLINQHRKTVSKESLENRKQITECIEMLREYRDRKFKEDLEKLREGSSNKS